jgi:dynein heavy chain 2
MRTKGQQKRLQHVIYQYVSRSLFKADRLMFALHLVNRLYLQQIHENVSTAYVTYLWLTYQQYWYGW